MGIEPTTLLLAPYSNKLSLVKYREKPSFKKKEEKKKKYFIINLTEIFKKTFQLAWKSMGGIPHEFEVNNKRPMNSCGKQTIFCTILFNLKFLHCIYCCGFWVFCRASGWQLTSICHSAAPLGQKWRCAGWCAFLQKWNGQTQLGYSSASMRKLQWMWKQEVKYIWNQTHALWLPHGFGHWKELCNDANVERLPGSRFKLMSVHLLTSLAVWLLYQGLSSASNEELAAGVREFAMTFHFHSIILPVFHLLSYLTYISSCPKYLNF